MIIRSGHMRRFLLRKVTKQGEVLERRTRIGGGGVAERWVNNGSMWLVDD